jgi:hemin uptake protein HemP
MHNAENSRASEPPADPSEEPAAARKPSPEATLPQPASAPGSTPAADPSGAEPPLEIASEMLLAGRSEIRIRHRGEVYRLTLTRAGKLILHK